MDIKVAADGLGGNATDSMTYQRYSINEIPIEVPTSVLGPSVAAALAGGRYEHKELTAMRKLLTPDDVYFEIGAGVGFLSTVAWRTLRSPDRIFVYEANPNLIPVIRRNWELNGVSGELENCVLGDGGGTVSFNVSKEFWASSATVTHRNSHAVEVSRRDFAAELARTRPSIMMMDIEGGERDLLLYRQLPLFLRKLVVELHPAFIGRQTCSEIVKQLLQQGFSLCFELSSGGVLAFQR